MSRLLSNTDMGDVELMHRVQVSQSGILLDNNKLLGDINALRELLKGSSSEIINALDSLRASDAITSKRYAYLTSAAGTKALLAKAGFDEALL